MATVPAIWPVNISIIEETETTAVTWLVTGIVSDVQTNFLSSFQTNCIAKPRQMQFIANHMN